MSNLIVAGTELTTDSPAPAPVVIDAAEIGARMDVLRDIADFIQGDAQMDILIRETAGSLAQALSVVPPGDVMESKALPAPKLYAVEDMREQIGFGTEKDWMDSRGAIDEIVAWLYRQTYETEPKTTDKLVNGSVRKVKVYPEEFVEAAVAAARAWAVSRGKINVPVA